ncbi:MAG: class I SAM-dependent methyltransferase [Vicinamibacteria bacterium]|nr:class I SAM-dependent methyltransferase [Vicinamibacteria bacterium]
MILDALISSGWLPDPIIRRGIRRLLRARQRSLRDGSKAERAQREREFIERLKSSPIAIHQGEANAQHYEVPPRFFELVLGRRLKYSSGWWAAGVSTLDAAEEAMLALTCERAQIRPGQDILELGCGWGSLTLYLAERFPTCRIFAVSNSRPQREFITGRARVLKLTNIEIETADISHWSPTRSFDRVVSVEMFEHLRNWPEMFRRVASWMKPEGRFFMHVFTHKAHSYAFTDEGEDDFMARHFFTGGMMPADGLAPSLSEHLVVEERFQVEGTHYARTAAAWLANMDAHRPEIEALFTRTYGDQAKKFWHYWRVFFMSCEELWAFDSGREWLVSHYRFRAARAVA